LENEIAVGVHYRITITAYCWWKGTRNYDKHCQQSELWRFRQDTLNKQTAGPCLYSRGVTIRRVRSSILC